MWPLVYSIIRANAVYITFPVAAIVGVIGYNIENLISDKHTPSSNSIQEARAERLSNDAVLVDPTRVERLKLNENVLGRNLSPSLQQKSNTTA